MPETNDDRPTLIPTGDEEQDRATDPGSALDFDDTAVDPHEVHLFV